MRIPTDVLEESGDLFARPYQAWLRTLHNPRSAEQFQLIAAAVSHANLAQYCVERHDRYAVAASSREHADQAGDRVERRLLSPGRRALLEFAEQLTVAPSEMTPETVGRMIDVGASVGDLRDVVEITAVTNLMNRVTSAVDTPAGEVMRCARP